MGVAKTALILVFYFAANILTVVGNKWLISITGFRQPATLSQLHAITTAVLGGLAMAIGCVPSKPLSLKLVSSVVLLAITTTLSVVLCLASLGYLPASFVQALGATTPIFTALLALGLQGRREHAATYACLAPIAAGVVLASGGEPLFHPTGVALQVAANVFRSLRSVMQAALLSGSDAPHPLFLLSYSSLASLCLLVPVVGALEPRGYATALQLHASNASFAPLLLLSCAAAFATNLSNFLVARELGALTAQVVGNAKNVAAAAVAIAVFGNPVTAMGITGSLITAAGVFAYSHFSRTYPAECMLTSTGAAAHRHGVGGSLKEVVVRSSSGGGRGDGAGDEGSLVQPLLG